MRIRTIKPEFYQDEDLSRVPRNVRLLAAALITWADDEGYFQSHPALIAGSLFPFDEDAKEFVSDGLKRLAEVGFVELFEGSIGFLPGFVRHQRINRPTPSRLKPKALIPINSVRTHGGLSEDSPTEGKGREGILEGNGREVDAPKSAPALSERAVTGPSIDTAIGFWCWAQDRREAVAGLVREKPPHPIATGAWHSEALGELRGDTSRLQAGFEAFLADPFWRNEAKARCSWGGWLKQWRQFVPGTAGPVIAPASLRAPAPVSDWSNAEVGEIQP